MNALPNPRSPRNRRETPAKPALTREVIVTTALHLLRTTPLETVTLRRIAAALDTGPASLFVYIRNAADLHAQILEALLAPLAAPAPKRGAWTERLVKLLIRYTHVLFDHPSVARHTMFARPHGPNYLAVVERILALLEEGGVPPGNAAWAVDLLLQLATATAAEHSARRADPQAQTDMAALAAHIAAADATAYPHVAALGDELLSGSGSQRFEWRLRAVIAGIVTVRRPVSAQKSNSRRQS